MAKIRSNWAASVFLMIASVFICLAAIEIALRVADYKPELYLPFYLTTSSRVTDKNIIMINPVFLRDDYFSSDNHERTIVTLGDSFTEGYPVDNGNTYPDVLGELLSNARCRIQVINAGQGDTGTDQHLKLFTTYILPALKPDIVIWSLYSNDITDNIEKAVYTISDSNKLAPLNGPMSWLVIRQLIFDYFPLPDAIKNNSYFFNLLLKSTEILRRWQVPENYKRSDKEWGLQKIRLAVDEMNQLAEIYGFDIYYLLIANQSLYLENADPLNWKDDVRAAGFKKIEAMMQDQVNVISARFNNPYSPPGTENENPAGSQDIFSDEKRDGNVLGDRHFNEIGYRLLAETVFEHIDLDDCGVTGK